MRNGSSNANTQQTPCNHPRGPARDPAPRRLRPDRVDRPHRPALRLLPGRAPPRRRPRPPRHAHLQRPAARLHRPCAPLRADERHGLRLVGPRTVHGRFKHIASHLAPVLRHRRRRGGYLPRRPVQLPGRGADPLPPLSRIHAKRASSSCSRFGFFHGHHHQCPVCAFLRRRLLYI